MHAVLTEDLRFAAVNLDHKSTVPGYQDIIKAIEEDNQKRIDFLIACLSKLGMEVNMGDTEVPSLSQLHLSSATPWDVSIIMTSLSEVISFEGEDEYLRDECNSFRFDAPGAWAMGDVAGALDDVAEALDDDDAAEEKASVTVPDEEVALGSAPGTLRVVVHMDEHPAPKETPYFNHQAYYEHLDRYRAKLSHDAITFGQFILYGDVVTSTNTLLEK